MLCFMPTLREHLCKDSSYRRDDNFSKEQVLSLFCPRMEFFQCLFELFSVHMHINLGGCDRFMSEHHLNCIKISSVFEQMCRKWMPKNMRTYRFADARLLS